jgi:hypothetical protein
MVEFVNIAPSGAVRNARAYFNSCQREAKKFGGVAKENYPEVRVHIRKSLAAWMGNKLNQSVELNTTDALDDFNTTNG